MRRTLLLCRHGNTFNPGEKVVMVGARQDLALTPHGIEQAKFVGRVLASLNIMPERVISGPLKRTKVFAEHVIAETQVSTHIDIDPRLVEFDYGAWSGLSNEEIIALSGEDALDAWQEHSIRPAGITFEPSPERARSDASALLQELSRENGICVVVTSNGRLREFGQVLTQSSSVNPSSFKVKTGHACVLESTESGWRVLGWDLSPDGLASILTSVR